MVYVHSCNTYVSNVCAKVVGNSKTNYVTQYRPHGLSFRYVNELINMQKCYNSTTVNQGM